MRRATRATRWAGAVRGSVHTLEKPLAVGQQLRTRSMPPDGLRMRRGSPKHLRKQPRRTSGAQPRGSRGVCGCIAGTGKPANAPAGHLTRRPRTGSAHSGVVADISPGPSEPQTPEESDPRRRWRPDKRRQCLSAKPLPSGRFFTIVVATPSQTRIDDPARGGAVSPRQGVRGFANACCTTNAGANRI